MLVRDHLDFSIVLSSIISFLTSWSSYLCVDTSCCSQIYTLLNILFLDWWLLPYHYWVYCTILFECTENRSYRIYQDSNLSWRAYLYSELWTPEVYCSHTHCSTRGYTLGPNVPFLFPRVEACPLPSVRTQALCALHWNIAFHCISFFVASSQTLLHALVEHRKTMGEVAYDSGDLPIFMDILAAYIKTTLFSFWLINTEAKYLATAYCDLLPIVCSWNIPSSPRTWQTLEPLTLETMVVLESFSSCFFFQKWKVFL